MLNAPNSPGTPAATLLDVYRADPDGSRGGTEPDVPDLRFERGTFTALVGPSGSGKSRLLRWAAGLERPDSGRVVLDGVCLGSRSKKELMLLRRARVGMIGSWCRPEPGLSVHQNISLGLRVTRHEADAPRVEAVLRRLGLCEVRHRRVGELSDGQRQRTVVGRALVSRPALLLADDPTAGLECRSARQVLGLMRGAVHAARQCVVMATHDPIAASFADRVVFLSDGAVEGEWERPGAEAIAERLSGGTRPRWG